MIWNSYDVPSVEMIYVRPEFRRQGIGKMLVDHAAEDYDDIYFDVPPQHQVMKDFLNALGYGEVESIRMHKG
jgi:ribosomal protein S18 acetylase RimI-like enzyme